MPRTVVRRVRRCIPALAVLRMCGVGANRIQDPEPSISDTCFTLTKRTSIAPSFFGANGETCGDDTEGM